MIIQEIRKIREEKSVEWAYMSLEQRNNEIKNGAKQILSKIEEIKFNKPAAEKLKAH
ncbi:MAG: hypothetical protein FWE90_10075 [Defluviitaleaceae bacterium]|nr:hypothetical protein [Defluviitaleaceae bacterium]